MLHYSQQATKPAQS